MQFCIYEDTSCTKLLPLVYLRPAFELRCGILTLREKIEHVLPEGLRSLYVRPYLAPLVREEQPQIPINQLQHVPTWLINGRAIADLELGKLLCQHPRREAAYYSNGEVVAAYISAKSVRGLSERRTGRSLAAYLQDLPRHQISTRLVRYPWDLIRFNVMEILNDCVLIPSSRRATGITIDAGAHLIHRSNIRVGAGSHIKSGAVLDASEGPIIIGRNVLIMPNAVVEGPAYIGDQSIIKIGAKLYSGTSIGKWCKVGGEVDCSILQSYSNKQHDGFLGHSYLGSWVNLGADTNTSDLKNTYGPVSVILSGRQYQTGMQFLGTIMGDHSKTGINVMVNTGTIIGVSCNIVGADLPPKFLPSFSWGGGTTYETYDLEKSLETARRVMARRNVVPSPAYEKIVREVFRGTTSMRTKEGIR